MKILIIEDDNSLRNVLKQNLEMYGYEVIVTEDFKNIDKTYFNINPDLTLLDINLPYYDGYMLCEIFSRKSNKPIIIISSKNTELEQIHGIELGADDYIVKPFSMQMLHTKIRGLLRRCYDKSEQNNNIIEVCGIKLDIEKFRISYRNKEVILSKNELTLLKLFFSNTNKVISREEILNALWDSDTFIDENTLNVNIKRVKDRLEEINISKTVIKNKRAVGYFFDTGAVDYEL